MKLSLFNTLTSKREEFIPADSNAIKMYVCGPTVYDRAHIGNARSVIVYDILYRILNHLYGKDHVNYVRNITDIDDKIINRAKKLNIPISELTKKTINDFHHDMEYLGCMKPTKEPKATDYITEIINIIQKLLDLDIAYIAKNHVYFNVTKDANYTKLSGRSISELHEAVRIDKDLNKKNAADFILWKPANTGDDESVIFASPFGPGRPGWHIECSAMSYALLGADFDIHGGGVDLIFPHHTNEIAQSICAFPGSSYAKYWVHNGFLTVNHEKMSKSLGNFVTVEDLIKQNINGDIARFVLMSTHYRKPLDYNDKALADAKKTLDYWYLAADFADNQEVEIPAEFLSYLYDDLNTHMAITLINDFAKKAHNSKKPSFANKVIKCANFLGLMSQNSNKWFKGDVDANKIDLLIARRLKAKKEKNWQLADKIRQELASMNIVIEDTIDGKTKWKKY